MAFPWPGLVLFLLDKWCDRSQVLPHCSVTPSSFSGGPVTRVDFKMLACLSGSDSPPGRVRAAPEISPPLSCPEDTVYKPGGAPGFHLELLAPSRRVFLALRPNGLQMSAGERKPASPPPRGPPLRASPRAPAEQTSDRQRLGRLPPALVDLRARWSASRCGFSWSAQASVHV